MIVVDASVVVKWFVDEDEDGLRAPDIVLAEVANVLRRRVRMSVVPEYLAVNAITTLKRNRWFLAPSVDLIDTAFALSSKMDHSVYNAIYLACALENENDVLVTADRKFADKAIAAGFGEKVFILGDTIPGLPMRQENDNG